jgi:hypothetical protein
MMSLLSYLFFSLSSSFYQHVNVHILMRLFIDTIVSQIYESMELSPKEHCLMNLPLNLKKIVDRNNDFHKQSILNTPY